MKLINHVLHLRQLITQAVDHQFDRLGLRPDGPYPSEDLPPDLKKACKRISDVIFNQKDGVSSYADGREQAIEEFVFTLFNRIAAIKVMETRQLFPEAIKTRTEQGGRSIAHNGWIEEHPDMRHAERNGLKEFLQSEFDRLSSRLPIFRTDHPYSILPSADELYEIIEAFNAIDDDADCEKNWNDDDILGWLYENYNAIEKKDLKANGEKIEYDKVSLQSQVYTPQWVVKFLVDNTLMKMYLEMHPESELREKYQVANLPSTPTRTKKDIKDWKIIDPAQGSGNFLIYSFQVMHDIYMDQMENYDYDISRKKIAKTILENNIYGVDLDERAAQLTQIGLYIKAWQLGGNRAPMPEHLNIVSTNFSLPSWSEVTDAIEDGINWNDYELSLLKSVWKDLKDAYKFGSLIRIEELLDGLVKVDKDSLFEDDEKKEQTEFKHKAIDKLRQQLQSIEASPYSMSKVNDALAFLEILVNKYDVAVANPPYTDSADFGKELKEFIEDNYKKPFKFNANLYATFIKRCCELTSDDGKVGLIHPMTFMYIKSFEDVRKFILTNTHISLFVEYGLSNLFGTIAVDPAFYILDKKDVEDDTTFISLDQYTRTPEEKFKPKYCLEALSDIVNGAENKNVYTLPQSKLKEIKSWPFIYWISDDFRKKFFYPTIEENFGNCQGLHTADNNRFLRYWWETNLDSSIWYNYIKGGPFNKWYGNSWLKVDWENNGYRIKNLRNENGKQRSRPQNERFYFQEGITYCSSGSKGASFRVKENNEIFDTAGSCIFPLSKLDRYIVLGYLNSKLSSYIIDCLNPTVGTQVGDIGRIPIVTEVSDKALIIKSLSEINVLIKKFLSTFYLIESLYKESPISPVETPAIRLLHFYMASNGLSTLILINEALIDEKVFDIYELSVHDRQMVLDKEGVPVGSLSVSQAALDTYKKWLREESEFKPTDEAWEYIENLPIDKDQPRITDWDVLYQAHNDWEEFCIRHNISPIEAWHQFKNANVLPPQRTQELAFELLTDVIRSVLAKDEDGIVPLVDRAGEELLTPRIENELLERGYTPTAISQIFGLLGMEIDKYLLTKFFDQLSNRLNLFMYLPKTPFIWHLSSGPKHALELYISIYKWSRDKLYRVKSVYASNRESALRNRLAALQGKTDSASRDEADLIKEQLAELKQFCDKVEDLLASGYDPKLDDGVGKNIAPLQKRGMIAYEVLNPGQLKKYLNADW